MDRGNARSEVIECAKNIFERCDAAFELSQLACRYVYHFFIPSSATRSSTSGNPRPLTIGALLTTYEELYP